MIADVSDKSIPELVSLAGRTAVITGGARGIGAAIAKRMVEAGASVVIGDLEGNGAGKTARSLRAAGDRVFGMECDMYDKDSIGRLADRAVAEFGSIDIWVNNAGIFPAVPLMEMTEAQWDKVLDLNLKGVFLGAQLAAERMIGAGRGGVIVNIASTASFRAPGPGVPHYVASKFGVRGLTQALAVELGPHDIRVLAVAPTFVDTPGTGSNAGRDTPMVAARAAAIEKMAAARPLGRLGVADDIARVVLFCASDLAVLMTGCTIPVDAGELAT
jgi:NAD(P)-dependent dehydrogenase (short-subunit alcohol dehydrogenase family)